MTSTPDNLQVKRIELIVQQLDHLPTLPAVAMRVLDATANGESETSEIVSLISSDVSLTTRILQLVHRADLGVRGDVNTVDRAVMLLGFEAVRSAVLAISVFETFSDSAPRGSGFSFEDQITGGVVPRNYIPSVEEGIIDALKHGPLGFPVVDLHVALVDGSYHTVDSSDMAFRTAGRIGIVEGLPQCQPVLLEPIHLVEIVCPTDAAAKINALMSGRRGQILGFDTREGWEGWDVVRAKMPEAEIGDLIVEVRSATAGAGTFTFKFDHMAELTGRTADQIVAARRAAE